SNFNLACRLHSQFKIENFGELIVNKLSEEDIIKNLSIIIKHLKFKERLPIALALAKHDMNLFLAHMDSFPVEDIPKSVLLDSHPALKQFFSYTLNKQEVLQKTTQEKTLEFQDIPEIKLDELLTLFDRLNFNDKTKSGYIDPNKLTKEGEKIS